MKSGRTFDPDSFRKNPWTRAFKDSGLSYMVPYCTRHTFAAWALTVKMPPLKPVSLMGHGSKHMIYEVYGKYVEDLEKDAGKIRDYFGDDFLEPAQDATAPRSTQYGESPAVISEQ
jgi:integrase